MPSDRIQANVPGGWVEVVKVKHGEVITKPGIYDIPMSWYHSNCCDTISVSSTGLRRIYQKSPLHFWADSYLNPDLDEDAVDEEESMPLRVGRAAHTLLLEPHLFKSMYATRPEMFPNWTTKAAQKWRADAQLDGFTVLDPKEMQNVHGVAASLRRHPLYAEGLLDGDIERALIWKDAKSGFWLKARPDVIPTGSNVIADLKCTISCQPSKVDRKVYDMGYDMQLALVGIGMQEILKRTIEEVVLVMVEYKPPHGVRIAPLPLPELDRAGSMLRYSLTRMRECVDSGYWPSYDRDDNEYVHRNSFQSKLIDAEISSGRLPKEF